jgi:hypothetical protein
MKMARCMLSSRWFSGVWILYANVSQQFRCRWITHKKAYNVQNTAKVWKQEMACIHVKCSDCTPYKCTSCILSANTQRMVSRMCAFGTLCNPCNFHSNTDSTILFNKNKFKILIWSNLNPGRTLANLTDCFRITKFTLCFQIYGRAEITQSVCRLATCRDRIPVAARFSAPVQTGFWAHEVSCTVGTGSHSPG